MIQATPIAGDFLQRAVAHRFTDLVTILEPTATADEYNEPIDAYTPLADHSELAAFVAPGDIYAKMKRQETLSEQGTTEFEYRRVLLNGYYPLIDLTHHAEIDGFEWDIVAIDIDTTHSLTQLLVERIQPGAV